ncbi:MAG: hypothetical protein L7H04_03325 [Vulcanisaeta sp.]|nr:hypothetical protein [Vulcanisaeta sp.]
MVVRLKDAVRLTDLADKVYKNLEPGKYVGNLAPSLGLIVQRDLGIADVEVSEEFLNPETFLLFTYFREPVKEALRSINEALQGRGETSVVFPLTHAMGLGKTHFLTILYHLYLNIPEHWENIKKSSAQKPGLQELVKTLDEVKYNVDVAKRTLLIPIDLNYRPMKLTRYKALFEYLKRIIERKETWLKQAMISEEGLAELKDLLGKLSEEDPSKEDPLRAAKELVMVLDKHSIRLPVLILLDELYASVIEAILGRSEEEADDLRKVLLFISSLINDLQGKQSAVLVYASAQQDIQRWSNIEVLVKENWTDSLKLLKTAVDYFKDRMQRFSMKSVGEVTEEEALEIVKKRIVEFEAPLDKILEEFNEVKEVLTSIVGQDIARAFVEKLKTTYPFSPIYEEFVRKLVVPAYGGDFSNAQHLRDLIKISSSVLGRAINDGESTLVSIAHIEHDDIKHVLQEEAARLWWSNIIAWNNYINNRYQDPKEKKALMYVVRSIYVKSVTDNVLDLLNMLQKLEMLDRETILRRALHQRDLILSLAGVVETDELSKLPGILDELENVPYIHVIHRDDDRYYLTSFISNPLQMIGNIVNEILEGLRDQKGELDIEKAIKYLREKLREYRLVGQFKEKAPLNFEFINLEDFNNNGFVKYISNSEFTVLLISPLEIAEKVLLGKEKTENIINKIKQSLEQNKNNINNLNMFAVVVPIVEKESLEKIVRSLANIEASERALKAFTNSEVLKTFASQEIERRKDLKDYMVMKGYTEEQVRQIVINAITTLKKGLESVAQQLTSTAVQDFVSEYISLFKKVISYDPGSGSVVDKDLAVKAEGESKDLEKAIASVHIWIANAIMANLNVKREQDIRAQLVSWIKGEFLKNEEVQKKLREEKSYELDIESVKELLIKGYSKIPIKPRSIQEIEVAIRGLSGILIESENLGNIALKVKDKYLILERVKLIPPPSPSPPRGVKGFATSNIDAVITFLSSLSMPSIVQREQLFEKIRSVSVQAELELEEKTEKSTAVINFKGSIGALLELAEPLVGYFNRHRNNIKQCNLLVELASEIDEKTVRQWINNIGIQNVIFQQT